MRATGRESQVGGASQSDTEQPEPIVKIARNVTAKGREPFYLEVGASTAEGGTTSVEAFAAQDVGCKEVSKMK